jgi:phosphate starvation-inducible PhoH-like protein
LLPNLCHRYCVAVDNPEHLYLTDNFIVTHNTFEEKVNPYITPIYDALDELVGPVGFQREIVNKSIQIRPLNYMRGCNFNDAICLHDEAQNNDFKSLLLYITRLGRNSKMIINGDPNQVDIKNSALMEVINKLEGLPGIGVVRFDKSAIVRNPLISQILDRLAPDQSI